MEYSSVNYDRISSYMLTILTEFSKHINIMSNSNDLLLGNRLFNSNNDFKEYINYFSIGRYYHFRCMGYMESLVLTKCYSVNSLCYWKNQLVMPAYNNITFGLKSLDMLKSINVIQSNPTYQQLLVEVDSLKKVALEIMNTIKLYNLPC